MVIVKDSKTGLVFEFPSDIEKEKFFNLWDKYEIFKEWKKCKHCKTKIEEGTTCDLCYEEVYINNG